MPVEFPLSPRTLNILRGRGLAKALSSSSNLQIRTNCQDGKLLCSAPICIFETEHSGFGREIEITGYAICPTCGSKAIYPHDRISDDTKRRTYWTCPTCKKTIPDIYAVWTQIIIAKHQGKSKNKRHTYYHKECYNKMSIDVDEIDE